MKRWFVPGSLAATTLLVVAGLRTQVTANTQEKLMNKIIALAFLAASALAIPAAPVLANSAIDSYCGPDAPEGYKRPGGYCEQIDDTNSLVDTKNPGPVIECYSGALNIINIHELDEVILVAAGAIDCDRDR